MVTDFVLNTDYKTNSHIFTDWVTREESAEAFAYDYILANLT